MAIGFGQRAVETMSASVTVKFFASLREDVGHSEIRIQASGVADLMQALARQLDPEQMTPLQQENIRIAVNQNLVQSDVDFRDGDEVAFLPPVTGG